MIELDYIQILAKDDGGVVQIIVMMIVGIFWAIGAVISKAKKKEAEAKANQLRQQQAMRNNNKADDDNGWQVIAKPPPIKQPHPQAARPVDVKKPSIKQFVRNTRSSLVEPEPVEHLHHVKAEPLPVLHADGELSPRHIFADDKPPKPISKPTPIARKPRLKPQQVEPANATGLSGTTVTAKRILSGLARLADPKAAQSAMVFHEILSPPKALRDGQDDMWD